MEQLLNRLLTLLVDEIGLYRSLLAVYQGERQALLSFLLDKIMETSKKKENLILKVKILEEQRIHIIDQIAARLNQPASDLTLTRLAEKVDIRYSYRLSTLGAELFSVLEEMNTLHHANRSLIAHCQGLVSGSLTFLSNNLAPDPVYHRDGRVSTQDRSGRLLARTV
jgi:flagellar biosynthesis/type III secretory pathway chaperone